MNITDYLVSKTSILKPKPEYSANLAGYSMFNTGGTEVEVSEFLYSFIKMIKPDRVLETGTHYGISSMYMGQACLENEKGLITTLDPLGAVTAEAVKLWKEVGVNKYIDQVSSSSLDYNCTFDIDFLFLDSEPNIRFDEFNRFWSRVKPGAFIAIHDLDWKLSYSEQPVDGMSCWPYGDFRPKLGKYIKNHDVQVISFRTPRGLTLFQKKNDKMAYIDYLLGKI
jgi:predicted O-methyltransferase YrrM